MGYDLKIIDSTVEIIRGKMKYAKVTMDSIIGMSNYYINI